MLDEASEAAELAYLTGHRARALFAEGAVSPVAVVEAQLARIAAHDGAIRAFTEVFADEALAGARMAEAAYARGGARPLEGLTLAVKDSHDIAGRRTTRGSLTTGDALAETTSVIVERLVAAGAVVIGKTTLPEFGSAGVTHSRRFGITGTPWDPRWTAGGSSGGSGAALAAGMATLATGSDIAGSIRVPAAACGVVGYKPPYGRLPGSPPLNLDFACVNGPLARSVEDCARMTAVMAGPHPSDMAALRADVDEGQASGDLKGWRIGISHDLGWGPVAPEVLEGLARVAETFRALGAEVCQVSLDLSPLDRAIVGYLGHLAGRELVRLDETEGDLLCDYTRHYAKLAAGATVDGYLESLVVANGAFRETAALLDAIDALVCPTLRTHRVPADAKPWEMVDCAGVGIDTDYGWVLTHPFNMLSRLPVLAVPSGIDAGGLPTGVQIVTRSYDDGRAFTLGRALERAAPWLDRPERRPAL